MGEGQAQLLSNSLLLALYGYHVHAIDVSSHSIQKLEKYARSQGIDNIDCIVADARTLQLAPDLYDLIVAVTLLDYLSREGGKKVAASLIHALKPGDFVFLEVMTIHDPGAKTSREEGETISETASFIKHYFEDGERATWFSTLETLLYEETMKYDDSHGEPHYHGVARLIARKQPA